jgi:hypothetical protein
MFNLKATKLPSSLQNYQRAINAAFNAGRMYYKTLQKFTELGDKVQPSSAWVSVQDALPDVIGEGFYALSDLVLCCNAREVFLAYYVPSSDGKIMEWEENEYTGEYARKQVQYWMPLPKEPVEYTNQDHNLCNT